MATKHTNDQTTVYHHPDGFRIVVPDHGREQTYHFVLNGGQVRLVRPAQAAGATMLRYRLDDAGRAVVCELHSHHTMSVSFSPTDDGDELAFRFYAVVGSVLERPEILLRVGVYGDFACLPVTTLFTDPGPFVDCYEEYADGDAV